MDAVVGCSWVETYVKELRTLHRPALFATDIREQFFVLRGLQMAITAALNSALYAIAAFNLGAPSSPREVPILLADSGWISAENSESLQALIRLRHNLIYDYETVDLDGAQYALIHRLDDLLSFVAAIRERLGSE